MAWTARIRSRDVWPRRRMGVGVWGDVSAVSQLTWDRPMSHRLDRPPEAGISSGLGKTCGKACVFDPVCCYWRLERKEAETANMWQER